MPAAGRDPDRVILRHALRVTVVGVPLIVVLGPVLHRWEAVGPAVFAVFTLGSFADFSGLPVRRAERYLLVGVVAALMLVVGTAAGQQVVTAVAVTGLVTFTTFVVGALGGPWFTARFPVIIAFLYAATAPSWAALGERVVGWLAGTVLIAIAALVLWPLRPRHSARALAGVVCRLVAGLLDPGATRDGRDTRELEDAIEHMRTAAVSVHLHPGAVARNERLVAEVVHLTERLACVVLARGDAPLGDRTLAAACVRALTSAAAVLDPPAGATPPRGEPAPLAPDLEALLATAPSSPGHAGADRVAAALDQADDQYVARAVLALAGLTEDLERVLAGSALPRELDRGDSPWTTLRSHLTLRSLWCRDAVRAAAALMVSMAVIGAGAGSGHAFWVALGTFSVLRADLASIGHSARATIVGTLAGFVVASALVLLGERQPWVLWAVLPGTMFLASWTGRFRPEVTAASFTTFLVGMYALAAPDGLATAEARVVTVTLGAVVTLAVGALLWPRPGSAPQAALAQVLEDARGRLRAAVTATTSWAVAPGTEPAAGRAWRSPLPVLSELDRALDTIATSAPGSVDPGTRRSVIALVDAAVVTTGDVGAPGDPWGGPAAAPLLTRDADLAVALDTDAAVADESLARAVQRLQGGAPQGQPSATAPASATARRALDLDGDGLAVAARLGADVRRVSRLADAEPSPTS